jgi:hypothetical protein
VKVVEFYENLKQKSDTTKKNLASFLAAVALSPAEWLS